MRIAILGVGAIGGLLAARLAHAGEQVSVLARGAHLAAIRAQGLRLIDTRAGGRGTFTATVAASDRIADLGPQDAVVLAVKAHQLADLAADVPALLGPETLIVAAQNGLPWWYFQKHGGALDGRRLASVDPDGRLGRLIPVERLIGCVSYAAAERLQPGVIRHTEGERFTLGEITGGATARVTRLSEALTQAGFNAPVLNDIRADIWFKLWGNATFNPVSALTGATLGEIAADPSARALVAAMMGEVAAVAQALGVAFPTSLEQRMAMTAKLGAHKTSMLQDVEAGRPPEVEALVGAVIEIARLSAIPTPRLDAAYALVKLKVAPR